MRDFNRGRGSSGSHSFGRSDFRGRDGGRPMLHKTVCSKCGKDCEVPFRPSGGRPVFCRECFQTVRPSDSMRTDSGHPRHSNFENRSAGQINRPEQPQYREQLEALNIKLDKILKILEPKIVEETKEVKSPKVKKVAKKSAPAKK